MPKLAPFLKTDIGDLEDRSILEALRPPLSFATHQSVIDILREKMQNNEKHDIETVVAPDLPHFSERICCV